MKSAHSKSDFVDRFENRVMLSAVPLFQAEEAGTYTLLVNADSLEVVNSASPTDVLATVDRAAITADGIEVDANGNDVVLTLDSSVFAWSIGVDIAGPIVFQGGSGTSVIQGADLALNWAITGTGAGSIGNLVSFTGVEKLLGGGKVDTLDYSGYSSGVEVNLQTGTGSGGFELLGFNSIIGTSAADILTGDGTDNTLDGRGGDDYLAGGAGNDTYLITAGFGDVTIVEDNGAEDGAGIDTLDLSSVTSDLTVAVQADDSVTVSDGTSLITLANIEHVVGGTGVNTLDYSAYTTYAVVDLYDGTASHFYSATNFQNVTGSAFNDILLGNSGSNVLIGGDGDDVIRGDGGVDDLQGGLGNDTLVEQHDADMELFDDKLKIGGNWSTISGFESAELTGGVSSNLISAVNFSGSLVLDGGSQILLPALNVHLNNDGVIDLTGQAETTLLADLNKGLGIDHGVSDGFAIRLTDGSSVDVSTSGLTTLQELFDAVATATNDLVTASIAPDGTSLQLVGTQAAGQDLLVSNLAGSQAGTQLGLVVTGSGPLVIGDTISDRSDDLRITLTNGTVIDVDLSGSDTLQDVLSILNNLHNRLTVRINATGTGLDVSDRSGGNGSLQISALNGSTAASDLGIESTGTNGLITGTSIVSGDVRLDGRFDDDRMYGGAGNVTFIGSGGSDIFQGNGGVNVAYLAGDLDFVFSSSEITQTLQDLTQVTAYYGNINTFYVTGGDSANTIDASQVFSSRFVIDGGAGDDTIYGGAKNDLLTGGRGRDVIDGGDGDDTIVETNDARFVLNGDTTSATLDMGEGTSEVVAIRLTGSVTAGTFQLTYDGNTTDEIDFDASDSDVLNALTHLPGFALGDVFVATPTNVNGWDIYFAGNKAGMNLPDITATTADLVGGGLTVTTTTQGADPNLSLNQLSNIEFADFTGGDSSNLMDAGNFAGTVTLRGGAGDDVLIGGAGNDLLIGGDGEDTLSGNLGANDLRGGDGYDTLAETLDADMTLTDSTLTIGTTVTQISGFETAQLTGGDSANTIDASVFTGVTTATELPLLNGGDGVTATESPSVDMAGSEGVLLLANFSSTFATAAGGDFLVTLTDGTSATIDVADDWTLQDLIDTLEGAFPTDRLTVALNSTGTGLTLTDSLDAGGNLTVVTTGSGSTVAAVLGIEKTGKGSVLTGTEFTDYDNDLSITLTDGTEVRLDLSDLLTIQDVLDAISNADPRLSATLSAAGQIVVADSIDDGNGLILSAIHGSQAPADLGLVDTSGTATSATSSFTGASLGIATVTIDGGAGDDTLTGSGGNDRIQGGTGNDVIDGQGGLDTLIVIRDEDITLEDGVVTIGVTSFETDTFTNIEQAELTGGSSTNTIDASQNTLSAVTLSTGGGVDVLRGGASDDTFKIDVTGLTAGVDKITVDAGAGDDTIEIIKDDIYVTQSDFDWVNETGVAAENYSITKPLSPYGVDKQSRLVIDSDINSNGRNLTLRADKIKILGARIDTGDVTNPGNLKISGHDILIDDGAILTTQATVGVNGSIVIKAIDDRARFFGQGFYNADIIRTQISIGDAIIVGGEVSIEAVADSQHYLNAGDFGGSGVFANLLAEAFGGILSATESTISLGVGVSNALSHAKVLIGTNDSAQTQIIADSFRAESDARIRVVANPTPFSGGVAAIGIGDTVSNVIVGNATITTVNDLTLRASSDNIMDVTAQSTESGLSLGGAIGVSWLTSDTVAQVKESATLTVGDDLFVQADTIDRNRTLVTANAGSDAKAGFAFALDYEDGNTQALLSGTIDVGGNLNVTAKQQKENLEKNVLYVVPAQNHGVSAQVSVGSDQRFGNVLENKTKDLNSSLLSPVGYLVGSAGDAFYHWLYEKVWGVEYSEQDKFSRTTQSAGAFTFVSDVNATEARIGNNDDAVRTTVDVAGFTNVTSTNENRHDATATAVTESDPDKKERTTKSGKTKKINDQADQGNSLAIVLATNENHAQAVISGDVDINSGEKLHVIAESLNQLDPDSLPFLNLIAPFRSSNNSPTYSTEDGTTILEAGDIVRVGENHTGHGDQGNTYEYVGPDGAEIDLSTEDFSDTANWKKAWLGWETYSQFTQALTSYFDSNLGLDSNLFDTWTQTVALGQKTAVAIASNIVELDHRATAVIKNGATVNQDSTAATGTQQVVVEANSAQHSISLGGGFQTPGITSDTKNTSGGSHYIGLNVAGVSTQKAAANGGKDTKSATGIIIDVTIYENEVTAEIENGVELYADSLKVTADSDVFGLSLGAATGKSRETATNIAGTFNIVNNETLAHIGDQADIVVGSTNIGDNSSDNLSLILAANDQTDLITISGSFVKGGKSGVGPAEALNLVDRTTAAILGANNSTSSSANSMTVGAGVQIDAKSHGFIGSIGVAGAYATTKQDEQSNYQTGSSSTTQNSTPIRSSSAVAVSAAFNIVNDVTKAELVNVKLTTSGDVLLDATNAAVYEAFTIGGALANSEADSVALAGAVSTNRIDGSTRTLIQDSTVTVTGGNVEMSAINRSSSYAHSGAASLAWNRTSDQGGDVNSTSLGSAISINDLGQSGQGGIKIQSVIENSAISSASLDVEAIWRGEVEALAVGVAAAAASSTQTGEKSAAAGAGSFAFNTLNIDTLASISSGSSLTTTGSVSVVAKDDADYVRTDSFGLSISYAASNGEDESLVGAGAIGIAVASNTLRNTTIAEFDGSTGTIGGNFELLARSSANIDGLAIGVAGAGASGNGETLALAGAGSGVENKLNNEIAAIIKDSRNDDDSAGLDVDGNLTVQAIDRTSINADAGGFALSLARARQGKQSSTGLAIGIGVTNNQMGTDGSYSVKATVDNSLIEANAVTIDAQAIGEVESRAMGGAFAVGTASQGSGFALSGAGALALNELQIDVSARLRDDSDVETTTGDLNVSAVDQYEIFADAGGVSVALADSGGQTAAAKSASLGAAVSYNTVAINTSAFIQDSIADVAGDLSVQAVSEPKPQSSRSHKIDALAFGVALSASGSTGQGLTDSLAGAGSVGINQIDNSILAYIDQGTNSDDTQEISVGGDLLVQAYDAASIRADAGGYALAASGSTGQGATGAGAVGVSIIDNQIGKNGGHEVRAYLNNVDVGVTGTTTISAKSEALIEATAIGAAGAGALSTQQGFAYSLSGAGAGTYNTVSMQIEASIKGDGSLESGGNTSITARDLSEIFSDAGAGALAIASATQGASFSASIGVGNSVNIIDNGVRAFIDTAYVSVTGNLSVTATADDRPSSGRDYKIDALAIAVAVSVSATSNGIGLAGSGAGAEAVNQIDSVIEAYILNSTGDDSGPGVEAAGDVTVSASDNSSIRSDTGGFSAAVAFAAQGSGGGSLSVGASQSLNDIGKQGGHSISAFIEDSEVTASGDLTLDATSTMKIDALAMGGSLAGAKSAGLTGALAGAGAGTRNRIAVDTSALITDSTVTTATDSDGDIIVQATDDAKIIADAGGIALAVALGSGGTNIGVSVGMGAATNEIRNTVEASITSSTVTADAGTDDGNGLDGVRVLASSTSEIDSFSLGGAIALSGGSETGFAVSASGGFATNDIANSIDAFLLDSSVTTTDGSVDVKSTDGSQIESLAIGGSLSIAQGSSFSAAVALAVVIADNEIKNTIHSGIDGSTVTAENGSITVKAQTLDSMQIHSTATAASISAAVSEAGVAFSGAGASASNLIENDVLADVLNDADAAGGATTTLTAGSTVTISAVDSAQIDSFVGSLSGSLGFVGIGLGVSLNESEVNNNVHATLDATVLASNQTVNVLATSDILVESSAVATSNAVGVWAAAGGGGKSTAKINGSQVALVGANASLTAGNVQVKADADQTAYADGTGMALAVGIRAAAAGAIVVKATIGGTTQAHFAGSLTSTNSLTIKATNTGTAEATATALAGGLGLGGSGAGADTLARVNPTVDASTADNLTISLTGDLTIDATATPFAKAVSNGISISPGLAAGVNLASAETSPDVDAYVGSSNTISAANLSISATQDIQSDKSNTAKASAFGVSASILIGALGASITAKDTGSADVTLGADSDISVTGDVSLAANTNTSQSAKVEGISVGIVAIGAAKGEVKSNTTTRAELGTGVNLSASTLNITADSTNDHSVHSETSSSAFVGVGGSDVLSAAESTIDANSTTTAVIAGAQAGNTIDVGELNLKSSQHTQFDGEAFNGAISILGNMSGAVLEADVASTVQSAIGDGADIDAASLFVDASNRTTSDQTYARSVSGAVIVSGSGAKTDINIDHATSSVIGDDDSIDVTGEVDDPGQLIVQAHNHADVLSLAYVDATSLFPIVVGKSQIDLNTFDADVTVGNSDLTSDGSMTFSTWATADIYSDTTASSAGLAGFPKGVGRAVINSANRVTIAPGASLTAEGDINLLAGIDRNPTSITSTPTINMLTAQADVLALSQSAASDSDVSGTAQVNQINTVHVQSDADNGAATVKSVADVVMNATDGIADAYWQTIRTVGFGRNTRSGGKETAANDVIVDGHVEVGTKNKQSLTVNSDGTYVATDGVTVNGIISKNVDDSIAGQIAALIALREQYFGTPYEDIYLAEIQTWLQVIRSLGGEASYDPDTNIVTYQSQIEGDFLDIADVFARSGNIVVYADVLSGSGTLIAPGDTTIDIINRSETSLQLGKLTIPEEQGGHLYFNQASLVSNSEINTSNGDGTARATFNMQVDGSSATPVINIQNVPQAGQQLDAHLVLDGDISNLSGEVNIDSGNGSIISLSSIVASQLNIVSGGDYVLSSDGWYHVSGHPKSDDIYGTNAEQNEAAQSLVADYSSPQSGTGNTVVAGNVFIKADNLNVNGLIQSGLPSHTITIKNPSLLTQNVNQWIQNYGLGGSRYYDLPTAVYDGEYTLRFDADLVRIEVVDNIEVTGGYMQLIGHVLNTGGGELRVMDGYGQIKIDNQTGFEIVLPNLSTGQGSEDSAGIEGRISILDTSRTVTDNNGNEKFLQTTITRIGDEIRMLDNATYDASGNPNHPTLSTGRTAQYTVKQDQQFVWTTAQAFTKTTVYKLKGINDDPDEFEANGGFDGAKYADKVEVDEEAYPVDFEPLLDGEYVEDDASDDVYDYTFTTYDILNNGLFEITKHVKKTISGRKVTYDYKLTLQEGQKDVHTHSVRADWPIDISFIGDDQGLIDIDSLGTVTLAGTLESRGGAVQINSDTSIVPENDSVRVIGADVELTARKFVGTTAAPLAVLLSDVPAPELSAYSTTEDITLTSPGDLRINEIDAYNGDVSIHAVGSMTAVDSASVVAGNSIILNSEGSIGSAAQSFVVDTGAAATQTLTVTARGDIFITEQSGDLDLVRAESYVGDVSITVPDGSLIDASSTNEILDEDARNELVSIWENLRLVGDAVSERVDEFLDAYRAQREAEYGQYWALRGLTEVLDDSNTVVGYTFDDYDPSFVYSMSDTVRNAYLSAGYSTQYITQIEQSKTLSYHQLHAAFGEGGTYDVINDAADTTDDYNPLTYDPNFVYEMTSAEIAQVTTGVVWTVDQLLFGLPTAVVEPTSDTETVVENANVIGDYVQISASQNVGLDLAATRTIFVPDGNIYSITSEDDKIAILAAEADDLSFYVFTDLNTNSQVDDGELQKWVPGDTTTDLNGNGLLDQGEFNYIEIIQRDDVDFDVDVALHVEAEGKILIGAENDLRVDLVRSNSGDDVRIKVDGNLLSATYDLYDDIVGGTVILESATGQIGNAVRDVRVTSTNFTARANGDIFIHAKSGIYLGAIFTYGDVSLSGEDYFDGNDTDQVHVTNITANSLFLDIDKNFGTELDLIEVDLKGAVSGRVGRGPSIYGIYDLRIDELITDANTMTVSAAHDLYINRLLHTQTAGTIVLIAGGSIYDTNEDAFNIHGDWINLTAGGDIGKPDDPLDIVSDYFGVNTTAGGNSYLELTDPPPGLFTLGSAFVAQGTDSVDLYDIDQDGDLDAVTTSATQSWIYLNDGHGHFTESTTTFPGRAKIGDLDGDGDLDVFLLSPDGIHKILWNLGGVQGGTPGEFADSGKTVNDGRTGGIYRDAALGDVDADGDLDLAILDDGNKKLQIWSNDGTGPFAKINEYNLFNLRDYYNVEFADLWEDSVLDIVLNRADYLLALKGLGGGSFQTLAAGVSEHYQNDFVIGNFDNSSSDDVISVNDENLRTLKNGLSPDGGNFSGSNLTSGIAWTGVDLGDLDQDGDVDFFVTGPGTPSRVYLNNRGFGNFSLSTQSIGTGGSKVALGDLDGDGDLDAFVLGEGVWLNKIQPHISFGQVFATLEGQPANTVLGQIVAKTDGNEALTFTFVDDQSSGPFGLSSDGTLTLANPDVLGTTGSSYQLNIRVTDTDGLFSERTVTVYVADLVEAPVVTATTFTIPEDAAADSVLGTLTATDPESPVGDRVTEFIVVDGLESAPFAVDPVTGVVTYTGAGLNYEVQSEYSFRVQAKDLGGNIGPIATIVIQVSDVAEAASISTATTSIDVNAGHQAQVSGTFNQGDSSGVSFSSTIGSVTNNGDGIWTWTFSATDAGSQTVTVTLLTSNGTEVDTTFALNVASSTDTPVNSDPGDVSLSNNTVQHFAAAGTTIGTLSAIDPDGDPLTFTLLSNPNGWFAIQGDQLKVALPPDGNVNAHPVVVVQVSDGLGGTHNTNLTIDLQNIGSSTTFRRFDFNSTTTSATQSPSQPGDPTGYLPVLAGTAYTTAQGYGWKSGTPAGFDRGALAGSPNYSSLLRDANFGSTAGVFAVDLAAGQYEVTVTTGDTFARDKFNVAVVAGGSITSGIGNVTNVNSAAGEWVHRTFTVTVNSSSEPLELQFSDGGGDPYWVLNALEIRPVVSPFSISGPTGTLSADATTIDTFTVTNAVAGGAYTISSSLGTITQLNGAALPADADSAYQGRQIVAPGTTFTIGLQRPGSGGTADLVLQQVNGESRAATSASYQVTLQPKRFDFQATAVTPAAGHQSILPTTLYSPTVGYGWTLTRQPYGLNRGTRTGSPVTGLIQDANWGSATEPNTFQVDLAPNSTYDVTWIFGDNATRDLMSLTVVSGGTITSGQADVTNQSSAANVYETRHFQVQTDSSGQLQLQFSDGGGITPYWVVNALELIPTAQVLDLQVPDPGPVPADGSTANVTIPSLNYVPGALYTVQVSLGTIGGTDADPFVNGFQIQAPASGDFVIPVISPLTGGTATLSVTEVTGGSSGTGTITFTAPTSFRFDFGTNSSPTASGYTAVTSSAVYSTATGRGWAPGSSAPTADIGQPAGDALARDFAYGNAPATFQVHVPQPTTPVTYQVTVYVRDDRYTWNVQVAAEGIAQGSTTTQAGVTKTITFDISSAAVSADGILDLTFSHLAGSYWVVNGVDIVIPQMAASLPSPGTSSGPTLTDQSLHSVVNAALARFQAAGASVEQMDLLRQVQFDTRDLGGPGYLGITQDAFHVLIDDDAAGWGWSIDSTPLTDEEFLRTDDRLQVIAGPASQQMDLLSVVMHEMTNVLRLNGKDVPTGLLQAQNLQLNPGERWLSPEVGNDLLDEVFEAGEMLF